MCGVRSGTSTQICRDESQAIFVQCYGHALNLAADDTIRNNQILRNTLDTTFEISKLLKYSPRREGLFNKIKVENSPGTTGFRILCPTRWTVRACSLSCIISNYALIQAVWDEALDIARDSENCARIIG